MGTPDEGETAVRRARQRLRTAGLPIAQTALAAGLAWLIASDLLGYERPFFAPVAAVLALGTRTGRRSRRTVEIVIGVAVGIAVADLIVLAIGTGPWQVVIVAGLAMSTAALVGGSPMLVSQAATSAILVATIEPPTPGLVGLVPHRFFHALIGGIVALAVSQVLLPLDPLRVVRRAAEPIFVGLGAVLDRTAQALAAGDRQEAEQALIDARAVDPQVRYLHDVLAIAGETARLAPFRRPSRGRVDSYASAATQVDLAVRNTRVLARASVAVLNAEAERGGGPAPAGLAEAVADLARAVCALGEQFTGKGSADTTRRFALDAAACGTALLPDPYTLALGRAVGQVRSTVIDLLRSSGMDLESAYQAMDDAATGNRDS